MSEKSLVVRQSWLLVLYLFAITLSAFLVPSSVRAPIVVGLILLQLVVLAVFRSLSWQVLGVLSRLKFLFFFLIVVNAFIPGAADDVYWTLPGPGWQLNLTGLQSGLLMSAQIALVVLTTYVVRTIGDENSLINGLRSFRVTPLLAYSLDTTLAVLDGSWQRTGGRGDGSGGGGGGGHGHRHRRGWRGWLPFGRRQPSEGEESDQQAGGGLMTLFRSLRHGDFSMLFNRIEQQLQTGARHAERLGLGRTRAQDVGVIGGVAAAMMAFKLVKILPGIPVFQGAKTIFFIPLYMLAADRTHCRWGGTVAGGIMGFIGFLNGDSRYGVFEILKHVAPGFLIDLVWPIVKTFNYRIWILFVAGLLAAAARTSTQFMMIVALGADNATFLIFPAMKLIPNMLAGALSTLVSHPILSRFGSQRPQPAVTAPSDDAAPANDTAEPVDADPAPPPETASATLET